jgi:hypothetical protein
LRPARRERLGGTLQRVALGVTAGCCSASPAHKRRAAPRHDLMSNDALQATVIGVVVAQLGALIWVLLRRRNIHAVLGVNLLFAVAVLFFVVPGLPHEVSYVLSAEHTEWLDYKGLIWSLFEVIVLISTILALFGIRAAPVFCLGRVCREFRP